MAVAARKVNEALEAAEKLLGQARSEAVRKKADEYAKAKTQEVD